MKNVIVLLLVLLPMCLFAQIDNSPEALKKQAEEEAARSTIEKKGKSEMGGLFGGGSGEGNGILVTEKDYPKGTVFIRNKGTTMEEYLYCTKGYSQQLKNGLDAQKKGYEIKELDNYYATPKEQFKIHGLYKENQIRAVLVHHVKGVGGSFYCVVRPRSPHAVQELYKKQFSNMRSYSSYLFLLTMNRLNMMLMEES